MAKIWLVIHHPFRRGAYGSKIAQETRDRTFLTSIDVIRYARLLETQQKTMKWGWLFKSYFQWHAIAFLLAELCVRTSGSAVEDAWAVVEEAWPEWDKASNTKKLVLWKPVVRLMNKARSVRQKELEKRSKFPSDGTLGPQMSPSKPTTGADQNMFPTPMIDLTQNTFEGVSNFQQAQSGNNDSMDISHTGSAILTPNTLDFSQPNPFLQAADPLTDLNTFAHSLDGIDGMLNDPMIQNDPLLDANINWAEWDANMALDFQNEISQPINLNMEQIWGSH